MVTNAEVEDPGEQPRSLFPKTPTGIKGFDEITGGGLPAGRPSLVCGPPGAGKSLFALQFLVNGVTRYGEPGVFLTFEENRAEVVAAVDSLNFDLDTLEGAGRLLVDALPLESELIDTGEFDLEMLMVRLASAVKKIGAKRVAIDNVEALFATFDRPGLVRSELRRLFRWLKDNELTAVVTGERGEGTLTRHGIEGYLSDCVVVLDDRVVQDVATRRLRVLKYRGSTHGRNEYPFLIGVDGLEVLPITSLGLSQDVSVQRVSTGVRGLDEMLGGAGVFRGSGVLVSGSSGTGKTTIAACFADAACRRGEVALFFSFEESQPEIFRNMASVGLDLAGWVEQGLLHLHCERPTTRGLEDHLAMMQRLIQELSPSLVVIDPVSSLARGATAFDVSAMLMRQVYYLKSAGITAVMTVLSDEGEVEQSIINISSLVDTSLEVVMLNAVGERNRGLYVLKSRGTAHSNQIREFLLSDLGVDVVPVVIGESGVLTGSARIAAESAERAAAQGLSRESEELASALEDRRETVDAHVATLHADFAAEERLTQRLIEASEGRQAALRLDRLAQGRRRTIRNPENEP
ncbi:MAG TPA: circadian clock protein KaiC [Dermatophilaceae bacterium]|nr:circadian clock protein KaiC [Dermatophilaceae bacterium]